MNAYRIIDIMDQGAQSPLFFRHTLAAAHVEAKTKYDDEVKPDVRIQLVEIPTTALSVIDYLNGEQPVDPKILRTWKLTPRGGLVELDSQGKPLEKQV